MRALTGLARCVPQLAGMATATTVTTARHRRKSTPLPNHPIVKKMRAASSRATALATLVIMTMPSLLPACVQATPEAKKMWPPHVPISSHRLRIGALGAGFDMRLLALRQLQLRPAGRLTCRVHGRAERSNQAGSLHWETRLRMTPRHHSESLITSLFSSFVFGKESQSDIHVSPLPPSLCCMSRLR